MKELVKKVIKKIKDYFTFTPETNVDAPIYKEVEVEDLNNDNSIPDREEPINTVLSINPDVPKTIDHTVEREKNEFDCIMDDMRKSQEETARRAQEVMKDITNKAFNAVVPGMSTGMKCNVLFNAISKYDNNQIDWKRVNEILNLNINKYYRYNLFDYIDSKDKFYTLRANALMAETIESLPYHKCKCKSCKKEFTLSLHEINWYLNRDLTPPKRCPDCRKARRKKELENG